MIKLIAVGKIKEKALSECINEYVKRIQAYSKIEIIEVNDESIPQVHSKKQDEKIKDIEGERILSKIKEKDYVIVLDLHGINMTSEEFSKKIETVMTYQSSQLVFVIGGSLGLSQKLINRADMRWKLSDCTFPHQLCRLILCEQIYRAYTIMNHFPYHK